MVSYYEDENLCSQYVTDVKLSFGSKRKKLLKELCKFSILVDLETIFIPRDCHIVSV